MLSSLGMNSNQVFGVVFTNTPRAVFTILTSTNAALPLAEWTELGAPTEISPGQFQFPESWCRRRIVRCDFIRCGRRKECSRGRSRLFSRCGRGRFGWGLAFQRAVDFGGHQFCAFVVWMNGVGE